MSGRSATAPVRPEDADVSVLFVCLGNICRSPTAEGVFRRMLVDAGLDDRVFVDSAGTGDWHVGLPPDARATAAARQRGIDLTGLRARQTKPEDLERFDYVVAMDASNLASLRDLQQGMGRDREQGRVVRLLDFASDRAGDGTGVGATDSLTRDVPDPYFGGHDGFDQVLDLIEDACAGLLHEVRKSVPPVTNGT